MNKPVIEASQADRDARSMPNEAVIVTQEALVRTLQEVRVALWPHGNNGAQAACVAISKIDTVLSGIAFGDQA